MKKIKLESFITAFLIPLIFTLISCRTVPENNWSDEDKAKAGGAVVFELEILNMPTLYNDRYKIAQEVLNKCISKYPDIEDFKKNMEYSKEAFLQVMKDDYNINSDETNSPMSDTTTMDTSKRVNKTVQTYKEDETGKINDPQSDYSDSTQATGINYIIITPRAYFYTFPDSNYKRKAYLVDGENIVGLRDSVGFVYCVFTNSITKKTSKGWIMKDCLQ